jgi:endonuclease YncB( thermonuclease family)
MAQTIRYRGARPARFFAPRLLVAVFAFGVTVFFASGIFDLSGFRTGAEAARGEAVLVAFVECVQGRPANCVVDGDTIRHEGVVIRVADIDTPEVFSPQCADEAALGAAATERLLALVNAGPFEIAPSGDRDEDRYGRKLRVLMRDGQSLGDMLVAEGLAHIWDGARHSWC